MADKPIEILPALGTYGITNVNGKLDSVNILNFLQNMENKVAVVDLYFNKVGNIYNIQGPINFTSTVMDVLPEKAVTDGFLMSSTGDIILFAKDQTTLTAPSTGVHIISGFYFAENGENRNG